MSILIQDMEMPQKCGQCKLFHAEQPMYCIVDKNYRTVGAPYGMLRPDWCPLIELPPHGRIGDLDALVKDLAVYRGGHNEGYGFDGGMYEAYNNSIELVEDAPTIIEAERSETDA